MAEFYVSLPAVEIARQVAKLLNKYNKLTMQHNEFTIQKNSVRYFIEVYGEFVVGCVALEQEEYNLSKIFHVCVDEDFRRKGIAKKLIQLAIDNCETNLIYMTIREDNFASLKLASKLGFAFAQKFWSTDHWVHIMGRGKHANGTTI